MGPIDPHHSANGIRTRVWALRGPRPSPLDDSAVPTTNSKLHCDLRINLDEFQTALRSANQLRSASTRSSKSSYRPGGNRTPNRRFWRPVLYQLSYGPTPGPTPTDCGQLGSRTADNWAHELRTISNCGQPAFSFRSALILEGWLTGIEPATPGATDRCSNQLSYSHHVPPPARAPPVQYRRELGL